MEVKATESDWKVMKRLQPVALERFCDRTLSEVTRLASEPGKSSYERYNTVFQTLRERDEELGKAFDDLRRNTLLPCLLNMRRLGLVTDEEFSRFSGDIRRTIEEVLKQLRKH